MSDDMPDDIPEAFADDVNTRLLWAILTELRLLRGALQQPAEEAADELTCRCGATFADEATAHKHAREDHGAPRGAEDDCFST